ncbi:amino acid transporter [Catenuloplanes nepalensis]|uniref:Amino acid transporter n=1 Tax=Catenuloplanes nepalensis TaxID=587533 RepID=A0ABT9MNA2_9ACTN|nr:APC family permease [Catenuloplanes nepalensis]MDP9792531.1 amino acid transporter [Catenuloplanes nepalensis]
MLVFAVGASSPLTVLAGGIPTMYQRTGVPGVPVSFLVMTAVFGVLLVGYVAMSRHVPHGAPFYAQVAQAVNPAAGVAVGMVALLGYNAIQISLFGLLSDSVTAQLGGVWWVWAAVGWLVVFALGRVRAATNAGVLGGLLLVELAAIGLFILAGFARPADGAVSVAPLLPENLMVPGVAGALVFAAAAFIGADVPPAFAHEARSSRMVVVATLGSAVFLGLLYALTSWAYAVAVGPEEVAVAAGDPARAPFAVLGGMFGDSVVVLAVVLLATSALLAMVAFGAVAARNVFAMADERVLPVSWARVSGGTGGGAPLGGSLVQSACAAVVIAGCAVAGVGPRTMFVWLSAIGAFAVLTLLTVSSIAARMFFAAGRGAGEPVWIRVVLPVAGVVAGVWALVFMAGNLASLLDVAEGAGRQWLVPSFVAVAGVAGLAWGGWLRWARPGVYARLGCSAPDPVTVKDHRLIGLEV